MEYRSASTQQSTPQVEHQHTQPIELNKFHGFVDYGRLEREDQRDVGCFPLDRLQAGSKSTLMWEWIAKFHERQQAKKKINAPGSSRSFNTDPAHTDPSCTNRMSYTQSATSAERPEIGRAREGAGQDRRKDQSKRPTLWDELVFMYQRLRDDRAEKDAGVARQNVPREQAKNAVARPTDESSRGRSAVRIAPLTQPPLSTAIPRNPLESHQGVTRKPVPVYSKRRGEVPKHSVKISQLHRVHNSVHLEHSPSKNYRVKDQETNSQKDKLDRHTCFSDFVHASHGSPPPHKRQAEAQQPDFHKQHNPIRETQWTFAIPKADDELVRESVRFSSNLDPAKAIKKAKAIQLEKRDRECYICGSFNSPLKYRDKFSGLRICSACETPDPVECSICGNPNSLETGYSKEGLWLCKGCRSPTEFRKIPPEQRQQRPKFPSPRGRIQTASDGNLLKLSSGRSHTSLASQGAPISDDDTFAKFASPTPSQGSGDRKDERAYYQQKSDERRRPTPPPKDNVYQHQPSFSAFDYSYSHLHPPGTQQPYALSPEPASKGNITSAISRPNPTSQKPDQSPRRPSSPHNVPRASFHPSTPRASNTPLLQIPRQHQQHLTRPASSIYPEDMSPVVADFPYPPPPIPEKYQHRPKRSSSVYQDTIAKAWGAWEPPASSRAGGGGQGRKGALNRRSSWYDFWKPVFGERDG